MYFSHGIQEVVGSIPISSTIKIKHLQNTNKATTWLDSQEVAF